MEESTASQRGSTDQRQRLLLRPAAVPGGASTPQRGVMARMFCYLYAAGGLLLLLSMALPHDPERTDWVLYAVAGLALIVAGILQRVGERLPMPVFHLIAPFGTVLIGTVALEGGPTAAPAYFFFLIWVSVSTSFFFGLGESVANSVFAAAVLGVVLLLEDGILLPALLLVTVTGTLLVNGTVMVTMRRQMDALVEQLDEAARTDVLTGLINRREFTDRFAHELARAARTRRPLGVVMLDLDGFKVVNDRFGHGDGDRALQRFAAVLREETRQIDTSGRIGGEEFAMLAPEADAAAAAALAERVRARVEAIFAHDYSVTVSCGVAAFPEAGDEIDGLLRAADRALYEAKRAGRNRVMTHDSRAPSEGRSDGGDAVGGAGYTLPDPA